MSPEELIAFVNGILEYRGEVEREEFPEKRARHGEERLIERHAEVWNETEARWQDGLHARYEYDSEGRVTTSTERQWYENEWHNFLRRFNTYNEDGLITEIIDQMGSGNGWSNESRYESLYEAGPNGPRLSESLHQQWNGRAWTNGAHLFFDYDEDGFLTETLIETQPGSDLGPTRRSLHEYNDAGLPATVTNQEWSPAGWVDTYRQRYAYDADGNPVRYTLQLWNGEAWEEAHQSLSVYVDGLQVEGTIRQWIGGGWVNFIRRFYTYAADGQQTGRLKQEWADGAWIDEWRDSHTYDGDGKRVGSLMEWMRGGQWVSDRRTRYLYEEATAGEASPLAGEDAFEIYPNPLRERATLAFVTAQGGSLRLDVFDLLGRRVLRDGARSIGPGEHAFEVDFSALPAGVYIVRTGGAVSESQRIVVME